MCKGVHKLEHLTVKVIVKNRQHLFDVHTKQTVWMKFDLLRMFPSGLFESLTFTVFCSAIDTSIKQCYCS